MQTRNLKKIFYFIKYRFNIENKESADTIKDYYVSAINFTNKKNRNYQILDDSSYLYAEYTIAENYL